MLYFGDPWDAPVIDSGTPTETPVGQECCRCGRPVAEGDQGIVVPHLADDGSSSPTPAHRGCFMADTMGHIFGLCRCTGWDDVYEAGRELVRRADAGELKGAAT